MKKKERERERERDYEEERMRKIMGKREIEILLKERDCGGEKEKE